MEEGTRMKNKKTRIAVVQAGSVMMQREATVEKAVKLIADAKEQGAEIVVFPEAFISGYPRGLGFDAVVGSRGDKGRKDFQRYAQNAVEVPSETTDELGKAAKEAGVYLVIGVIERDTEYMMGTLYCTVLYFGPDGTLLGKHRKLKPTGSERLIWGEGDGSTMPVFDTPHGKLGALICWENYMPLARAAMYAKGIQIYIAPTADSRDVWQATMRHIAVEGRCFVVSCNQYYHKEMYPDDLACGADLDNAVDEMCPGGSCVIDPLGNYIAGPIWGKEDILMAEINIDDILYSQFDFDVMGHYSRPDVFQLVVNEKPKQNVKFINEESN